MKTKFLLSIIFLTLTLSCLGQKWNTEKYIKKYNYEEVVGHIENIEQKKTPDMYAMYPNGKKGIYSLIANKIKIPNKAIRDKIGGTVILKYVVDKNGYVTDIEIIQSVSKNLDKAAIRVLKLMKRWIPGKKEGENVRVEYQQPFKFKF
jgi:TonB family protein